MNVHSKIGSIGAILTLAALVACGTSSASSAEAGASGPEAGAAPAIDGSAATSEAGVVDPSAAKLEFWDALGTGNIDGLAPARDHLVLALGAHPDDAEAARLVGMSYLASVGERTAEANPPGIADLPTIVQNAAKYLEMATELPTDPGQKIWNSAFYAGTVFTNGNPNAPPDPAKQAEGRSLFQAVVDAYPVFGLFNRAAQLGRSPRGSDDFATAVESFFLAYENCTGTKLDRAHPDVTLALNGGIGTTDLNRPCGNLPHVPHNIQGEMFAFADVLVKNGQPDAALPVYEAIKQSDGYATWTFRAQVDERLASDLAARAALYADPDSTKWPPVGASFCLSCHQR